MPTHSTQAILAALKAEGIDCEPHELGLAAYCADPTAYAKALKACQPTILKALPPACAADPMICDCKTHTAERLAVVKRGSREVRQPWQPVRRAA